MTLIKVTTLKHILETHRAFSDLVFAPGTIEEVKRAIRDAEKTKG